MFKAKWQEVIQGSDIKVLHTKKKNWKISKLQMISIHPKEVLTTKC